MNRLFFIFSHKVPQIKPQRLRIDMFLILKLLGVFGPSLNNWVSSSKNLLLFKVTCRVLKKKPMPWWHSMPIKSKYLGWEEPVFFLKIHNDAKFGNYWSVSRKWLVKFGDQITLLPLSIFQVFLTIKIAWNFIE